MVHINLPPSVYCVLQDKQKVSDEPNFLETRDTPPFLTNKYYNRSNPVKKINIE